LIHFSICADLIPREKIGSYAVPKKAAAPARPAPLRPRARQYGSVKFSEDRFRASHVSHRSMHEDQE